MAKRICGLLLVLGVMPLLSGCTSVVARVNGKNITRQEFIEDLERAQGLQVLQQAVLRRLILERATAEGVLPTAEEIKQRLAKFKQDRFNGDETEMRKWMKANAVDDLAIQDQLRLELATFKLRTRKLKPSDDDIKSFFAENRKEMFDKPVRVSFRQIVVPSKEAADKIIAQLNSEGAMFAEIARQVSGDQASKENGGLYSDLPWDVVKAQAPPIFAALKKLEPNQLTQAPVAFKGGFFIIKLIETKAAEQAKLEDPKTKDLVKDRYLQVNAIPEQQMMEEVMKNAEVVVLADRYKAAIEPFFAGAAKGAVPGAPGAPGAPGVPKDLEKQLQSKPEITEPTHVDEKAQPKSTLPKGGN